MAASASPYRGMSPAAKAKRKRGFLGWGIALLVLWFTCTALLAWWMSAGGNASYIEGFVAAGTFGGLFLVLGLIFFLIGFFAELGARSFNARDWAQSVALTEAIQHFLMKPRADAYTPTAGLARVTDATIVEVDRHFDRDTQGQILTTINHSTRTFGVSSTFTSGSSQSGYDNSGWGSSGTVNTNSSSHSTTTSQSRSTTTGTEEGVMSSTTRDNLMGDALFSVFETVDANGRRDTVRAISLSRPAAEGIIRDVVGAVCHQVGGPQTHAGGAVWAWVDHIIQRFAPSDISYVTDRLKAIHSRPVAEREHVAVNGVEMGRNAVLVTTLSIDGQEELETFPYQFPEMFATAIGAVTSRRVGAQVREAIAEG